MISSGSDLDGCGGLKRCGTAEEWIEECKKLGLKRVMICCYDDNIASEKTIIANGGIYEKTVDVDGRKTKRYWITVS